MEGFRLKIDGNWTVENFKRSFEALLEISNITNELRNDRLGLNVYREDLPKPQVHSIKFASPGHIDLVGFGKVVGEIRQLIGDIITVVLERKARKQEHDLTQLEIASAALEVQAKLLDNLERLAEIDEKGALADDISWSQRNLLESVTELAKATAEGRITGVSK